MSSLSLALKTNNKAEIIKACSHLTPKKVLVQRDIYRDKEFELQQLLDSYHLFSNEMEGNLTSRKKHLAQINDKIAEVKQELATIVQMPLIMQLREMDEQELNDKISLLLIDLIKYHKTSDMMSTDELVLLATRIIWQFGGLTVEDIAIAFEKAKNGEYGQVFNRVDGSVVMTWLQKYQGHVQAVAMERQRILHSSSKPSIYKNKDLYRKVSPKKLNDLLP